MVGQFDSGNVGKVYVDASTKISNRHSEYVATVLQSPKVVVYLNAAHADAKLKSSVEALENKLQGESEQHRLGTNRQSGCKPSSLLPRPN